MNIGIIVLCAIVAIILLIATVHAALRIKNRKEKEKLLRNFNVFVRKHHLSPSKIQTLNKSIIGIDRNEFKLIFMDGNKVPSEKLLLDLKEISDCRILKTKTKSTGYIGKIFLKCSFKNNNKPDVLLPFYCEKTDKLFRMMRLSKKALYWQKAIELFREPNLRFIPAPHKKGSM